MRLQSKVLLVALPLGIAFSAVTAFVASSATKTIMVRELGRRLRPQIEDFATGLSQNWKERRESALLSRLQQAQAFSGAEFAEALSPDGTVLAHTNVLETGKRRGDPAARAALGANETSYAPAPGLRGPLLVLATPVWLADENFLLSGGPRQRLGTVRLGVPLQETFNSAGRIGTIIAVMAAVFCLSGLGLILLFVRSLLRPVRGLEAATARVAAGDYGVEAPILSRDEFGGLAASFNTMAATLSRTVISRDGLEATLAIARSTLDASADGILVVDKNLRAITYNRRFVEMYGIPEELMRAGDVRAMAEHVRSQLEDPERFMSLATNPAVDAPERRDLLRLKDGRVFDRISQVYRIGGLAAGRTITTRDMTLHFESLRALARARDEAEAALAISRATIDASADGILVVGQDGKFITHNNHFLEMWNIPEEMARAGSDSVLVAEYVAPQIVDAEAFLQGVRLSRSDVQAPESRNLLRLKDGRVFERVSRPYLFGGEATGRTLTYRDLTLHLEGLRALSVARDEALETARVKSAFLANVSHEIRTPLNAVIGSSELLLGTRLDAEQSEYATNLSRASRTLLELVNNVLDFSKIEAGRMTVELSRLDPGALLADAAALLAPRAAEKGLALKTDAGAAASLELLGDSTRLRQILLNLLANAVKFTDRGEVSAAMSELSSDERSVELEFSVSDTGIGIPPEQAENIFIPFTQGDGSTTRRFGGTGLGLAICRNLVEMMGGTIGFQSVPGEGSRFWFRLTLERANALSATAVTALELRAPAERRDRFRILVVDDNEINRRLLARQLKRLGCPSVVVAGGRAALDELRAADFGLILLDCQMPDLDGFATAAEVRRLEAGRRRTPIAALTANATSDIRRRCAEADMDDFVPKPATQKDLEAAIERWDRPFDETALANFLDVAAEAPDGRAGLLSDFLADAEARLKSARAALTQGNFEACGRDAHSIKGAAAAVGARGLADLCRRLEESADSEAGAAREAEGAALLQQADAELARLSAAASHRAAA